MDKRIEKIIANYFDQQITDSEAKELISWIEKGNRDIFNNYVTLNFSLEQLKIAKRNKKTVSWDKIASKINDKPSIKTIPIYKRKLFKYAASILILITIGNYVYKKSINETVTIENTLKEIKPGYEKATLVLSDGTIIDLEQHKNELITSDNQMQVQNTDDGLVYNSITEATQIKGVTETLKYNTLQVPIGGIYQVKLPDGTKVWLNSASSLRYPERFNGSQRIVELTGEAYFDVTKDTKEFIVKTNTADITVLGTQFNVSSYNEDSFFSSTLVEGKIKLTTSQGINDNNSVILSPNQRGLVNKALSKVEVKPVETEVYTAWKEGKFYFERERLDQILTRMARWYNVDVAFEDDSLKKETFTGVMLKNKPIDNLLNMISETTRINYIITKSKINEKYELKLTRN
ncbi:FecR family protein [Flavivirga spongiicola]|uniref:FecR domain-containing protein n=1 Tax=Flavivirga spongiicola TaxID=421621 RepID=A0ABU7XQZ9_9FLAO|nr:FecR domain-containing protein [Flavivirga sp. MEBiC05379]MDO5977853.1 FecR domain-containing protein [Flavivirga sp. MEBiC05379]